MRGVGILLVVIAHVIDVEAAKNLIYAFHMPLFFFISGLLLQPNRGSLAEFIRAKLASVFVPYVLNAGILGLSVVVVSKYLYHDDYKFVKGAVLSVLWFIPALLMGQILVFCLKPKCISVVAALTIIQALGYFGLLPPDILGWPGRIAYAAAFISVGSRMRDVEIEPRPAIVLVCATACCVALFLIPSLKIDIAAKQFGFPLITPLIAISLIFFLVCVIDLIRVTALGGIFAWVGAASFVIYLYHQLLHALIRVAYVELSACIVVLICVFGSISLHYLFGSFSLGARFLLGGRRGVGQQVKP